MRRICEVNASDAAPPSRPACRAAAMASPPAPVVTPRARSANFTAPAAGFVTTLSGSTKRPAVPATFAALPARPGRRASAVSPPVSTVEMSPNTPAGSSARARLKPSVEP
ncbi:hypothetical protein ACM41_24270 [Bradyrhizobium sp. CCBAU 21362]|nr:hypothetical protein [Bradyrhizobium sp. CCBAU 21362]